MRKVVQFVEQRRGVEFIVLKDRWEFKPKGRLQFLQEWAWRFLQWRKALVAAVDQKTTYTRHVIDTQDVMRRLMEQRLGLFEYGEQPKELLIGAEDFAELMGSPAIHQSMMFQADYNCGRQIMGLKVRIVPWMRGMVVMP